jgi:hypothetical protein
MEKIEQRVHDAIKQTADLGRTIVYANAPVAFGVLRETVEDVETEKGAKIQATAPYAAAVEVGSRPHTPPLEPLIEWVKLRGAQGADVGPGAVGHPGSVAAAIRATGDGTSTPIDAPEIIARRIQAAIAKNGTQPTWFMRKSLPDIFKLLDAYMKSFLLGDSL